MNPGAYFTENFTFFPANGTIAAALLDNRMHCVGTSTLSGPASQIWSKPVSAAGAMAVFVVNGALLPQRVSFSLAEANITAPTAAVRDLWSRTDLPVSSGSVAVEPEPHGSAMLLLTPIRDSARRHEDLAAVNSNR